MGTPKRSSQREPRGEFVCGDGTSFPRLELTTRISSLSRVDEFAWRQRVISGLATLEGRIKARGDDAVLHMPWCAHDPRQRRMRLSPLAQYLMSCFWRHFEIVSYLQDLPFGNCSVVIFATFDIWPSTFVRTMVFVETLSTFPLIEMLYIYVQW